METGVVYIKFSKTSEAARALEEMNGKSLGTPPGSRPLKVLVASRYASIASIVSFCFFFWERGGGGKIESESKLIFVNFLFIQSESRVWSNGE